MSKDIGYLVVIMGVVASAVLGAVFAPGQAAVILPLCTLVCVQVLGLLQGSKAAEKAEIVAVKTDIVAAKVEQVAAVAAASTAQTDQLAVAVNETREVSKATHVLVNQNRDVELDLTAQLSRWKSEREPSPENIAATERAEQMLTEHRAKQAAADQMSPQSGFGTMPAKTPGEAAAAVDAGQNPGPITSPPTSSPPAQLRAGEVSIQAEHVTLNDQGRITEITGVAAITPKAQP